MQEIRDPACLERLYQANRQYFGTRPPVMRLLRFEKGEYLSHPLKPLHQFLLVVQGSARIYGIQEDSRMFGVSYVRTNALLGDIEFCQIKHNPFFTEAVEPVLCLALPFAENRAVLENDPVFLRFVMGQLARKLALSSRTSTTAQPLEERLLFCLQQPQFGGKIEHLDSILSHLHCSRRQLQRVLKKLCDAGQLEKTGRGCYRLAGNQS